MMQKILFVVIASAVTIVLNAPSLHAYSPGKGMFLVAKDQILDPRFRDRVILLIQHDDQGSAGLVVNRTSRLPLESVLTQESQLSEKNKTLSYGGPVEPKTLLALVKVRDHPPEPADIVMEKVYITGIGILEGWPDYQREVVDFRAFVGYTGWAPGQLNAEMERGDWDVLPADEDNIFTAEDETLWESLRDRISAAK